MTDLPHYTLLRTQERAFQGRRRSRWLCAFSLKCPESGQDGAGSCQSTIQLRGAVCRSLGPFSTTARPDVQPRREGKWYSSGAAMLNAQIQQQEIKNIHLSVFPPPLCPDQRKPVIGLHLIDNSLPIRRVCKGGRIREGVL